MRQGMPRRPELADLQVVEDPPVVVEQEHPREAVVVDSHASADQPHRYQPASERRRATPLDNAGFWCPRSSGSEVRGQASTELLTPLLSRSGRSPAHRGHAPPPTTPDLLPVKPRAFLRQAPSPCPQGLSFARCRLA